MAAGLQVPNAFSRWGYWPDSGDSAADRWTLRACILYSSLIFSILNPGWNEFTS
jgi:hypothetical protein